MEITDFSAFNPYTPNTTSAVTGSSLARTFLLDCLEGRDSVDIVTLGDSNASYPSNYGYTQGLNKALGTYCRIPMYATPLFSCGSQNFTAGSPDNTASWGGDTTSFTPGVVLRAVNTGVAGAGGTSGVTSRKLVVSSGLSSELTDLQTFLYTDTAGHTVDLTSPLIKPINGQWMPVCFNTGDVWQSTSGYNNSIELAQASPIKNDVYSNTGSQLLAGRLVHATFPTGNGSFQLRAMTFSPTTTLASSSTLSCTASSIGYVERQLNFTSPADVTKSVYFTWDGSAQGTNITGPACFLWASIIRRAFKGYSVSNLATHGDATSSTLNTRLANTVHGTRSFLGEIHKRQVAAGGSGRIIIWINIGINPGETASSWTANMTSQVNFIRDQWYLSGGSASNIAFVISASHTVTSSAAPGTAYFTGRPAIARAAWDWGTTFGAGVTVVDLAVLYPPSKMFYGDLVNKNFTGTLYDSGGQSHLRTTLDSATNGYDAMSFAVIRSLLS